MYSDGDGGERAVLMVNSKFTFQRNNGTYYDTEVLPIYLTQVLREHFSSLTPVISRVSGMFRQHKIASLVKSKLTKFESSFSKEERCFSVIGLLKV